MAEPTKTISLRIPLRLYEEMLEDINRIAAAIERERGGGHNSKNAALVRLIEAGMFVYRLQPDSFPKSDDGPPPTGKKPRK